MKIENINPKNKNEKRFFVYLKKTGIDNLQSNIANLKKFVPKPQPK